MSAASEESTADFLPKAPQAGKKGGRATETGGRNGRQKRAAGPGRQKRGGRNGAAETGRQEADAGERAEGTGSRRTASKKPDKNTAKPETDRNNPKLDTKIGKQAGKARKLAEEPDAEETGIPKAKRIGQGQNKKKETRNQD